MGVIMMAALYFREAPTIVHAGSLLRFTGAQPSVIPIIIPTLFLP